MAQNWPERWRDSIGEFIEYFLSTAFPQTRAQMDYSPQSLEIVEAWLLQRYSDIDALIDEYEGLPDDADPKLLQGALFYIGEVYRKQISGNWNNRPEEGNGLNNYDDNPVLDGFPDDLIICPYFDALDAIQYRFPVPVSLKQGLDGWRSILSHKHEP